MTRAYARHVRGGDLCMRGARAWFAHYNLDYRDFLFNGIECDTLEALHDHFGDIVARNAREEEAQQQGDK